jgi:amidophosphoribosyltransferase
MVDDSLVRGTTSRKIVRMVREAGAKEVHVRISCPPTVSPCYYGVDTPTREELLAAEASCIRPHLGPDTDSPVGPERILEEIRVYLGADSVGYLSLAGLRQAVGDTSGSFCTSCYTGVYPTECVQLEVSPRRPPNEEAPTVTQETSRRES